MDSNPMPTLIIPSARTLSANSPRTGTDPTEQLKQSDVLGFHVRQLRDQQWNHTIWILFLMVWLLALTLVLVWMKV